MEALNRLTAADAAAGIKRGDFTSEALVAACLARIAEREPVVEAWAHLDPNLARAQARAADAALRAGRSPGRLHGIPVAIKDIIDTRELPTENGTPIFAGRRPAADAAVVGALKAAGAMILGKTVTTELAFFAPGKTRNPADPGRSPGGSSSGSAAAVADFHVPLALGTQTAGSILRPASFCGAIGWKPTFGLVSRAGVLPQSRPLDTVGAFARSVEDIALVMSCLAKPDPADPDTLGREPSIDWSLSERGAPPKLAFVRQPAWPLGEQAMHAALFAFVKELGTRVVTEVELPESFERGLTAQQTVQFHDIAQNYGPLLDAHPDKISAKLTEVIGLGRQVSVSDYGAALALREPLYAELAGLIQGFDAFLTPAAAGPAPNGLGSTGSPAFNALWTFLGVPAISLPLLEAGGLPLGVQLVGRRFEDRRLLAVARRLMAMV